MIELFTSQPPLAWLVAGLVLMLLDTVLSGVFLLWVGLAATGTGLVLELFSLGLPYQAGIFVVLAAVSVRFALSLRQRRKPATVNAPGSGLIGRPAVALRFDGREGRVRLGDSDWEARLDEGAPTPAPSSPLRVTGIDGTVLVVRPEMSEP